MLYTFSRIQSFEREQKIVLGKMLETWQQLALFLTFVLFFVEIRLEWLFARKVINQCYKTNVLYFSNKRALNRVT